MGLDARLRQVIDTPEISNMVIFVDGEIYNGHVVFDCLTGIGWKHGRPVTIELAVPRWCSVVLLDLTYGKIRPLVFNNEGKNLKDILKSKTTKWDVVVYPQDLT